MEIRTAVPPDGPVIAKINNDGWRVGYAGVVEQSVLDSLDDEARGQQWSKLLAEGPNRTFIAERGGVALGFSGVRVGDDGVGELAALYVAPQHWNSGAGGALLQHAEIAMRQRGAQQARLDVLAENPRARSFYEKHGWTTDNVRGRLEVRGAWHEVVTYTKTLGAERGLAL